MSKQGVEFLESWKATHITEGIKKAVDGDGASVSVEMAERLIADVEKAGLKLDELEGDVGEPIIFHEAQNWISHNANFSQMRDRSLIMGY